MIRYKVVTKDRKSINSRRDTFMIEGYIRTYKKGTIVEAVPKSFGLYCFKRKKDAEAFIIYMCDYNMYYYDKYMIIRVKPIGDKKGYRPKYVFSVAFNALKSLYEEYTRAKDKNNLNYIDFPLWKIPEGTICYQSVEVLD